MTMPTNLPIAILGAGITGLTCARAAQERGESVVVFDKGRGVGGRTSTRQSDDLRFDHGAPMIQAEGDAFQKTVAEWVEDGVLAPWGGAYVAVPGMNGLAKYLAEGLDVKTGVRITDAAYSEDGWHLTAEDGTAFGPYRALVSTLPPPQAIDLLGHVPGLPEKLSGVAMTPVWTLMVGYAHGTPPGDPKQGHDAFAMVLQNDKKPGRPNGPAWVAHASRAWTEEHLELDKDEAAERLFVLLHEVIDLPSVQPAYLAAHRWRYGQTAKPLGAPCAVFKDGPLVLAGDWCLGDRIEHAFLSGTAAAMFLGLMG